MSSANCKLVENMELQIKRVIDQLKDLEECKNDLSPDEIDSIREETVEQIKEFKETLDRMNKGDVTLDTKVSQLNLALREAIADSFKTSEMIKMFGVLDTSVVLTQISKLEENFKLKKISQRDFEEEKLKILTRLQRQGYTPTEAESQFIKEKSQIYLEALKDDDE